MARAPHKLRSGCCLLCVCLCSVYSRTPGPPQCETGGGEAAQTQSWVPQVGMMPPRPLMWGAIFQGHWPGEN